MGLLLFTDAVAVLLRRRLLKVVDKGIFEGQSTPSAVFAAVGFKRRRAVKSGADAVLEDEEDGDEEDDEEDIFEAERPARRLRSRLCRGLNAFLLSEGRITAEGW